MPSLAWQFNGPLAMALRIHRLPGVVANISMLAPPTPGEQTVIASLVGQELAGALLDLQINRDSPALRQYRALRAESARADAAANDLVARHQELVAQHAAAVANPAKGLARKLAAIDRQLAAVAERHQLARQEADAVYAVLGTAQAAAEHELALAADQQRHTAVQILDARRRQVEQEILTQTGDLLERLLAIDQAALQVRAGGDLVGSVRLLDELVAGSEDKEAGIGDDDDDDDDGGDDGDGDRESGAGAEADADTSDGEPGDDLDGGDAADLDAGQDDNDADDDQDAHDGDNEHQAGAEKEGAAGLSPTANDDCEPDDGNAATSTEQIPGTTATPATATA
jgi:hypothetical protein